MVTLFFNGVKFCSGRILHILDEKFALVYLTQTHIMHSFTAGLGYDNIKVLFFLPFQFITYAPVRVFIGSYELAGTKLSIPEVVGLQALAVVIMLIVYKGLWYFGIKKFSGVGA